LWSWASTDSNNHKNQFNQYKENALKSS